MATLLLSDAAKEKRQIIENERPTWTFKNIKTRNKLTVHPKEFFEKRKWHTVDVFNIMILGLSARGWIFNQKVYLNDEQRYQAVMAKRAKKAAKKAAKRNAKI